MAEFQMKCKGHGRCSIGATESHLSPHYWPQLYQLLQLLLILHLTEEGFFPQMSLSLHLCEWGTDGKFLSPVKGGCYRCVTVLQSPLRWSCGWKKNASSVPGDIAHFLRCVYPHTACPSSNWWSPLHWNKLVAKLRPPYFMKSPWGAVQPGWPHPSICHLGEAAWHQMTSPTVTLRSCQWGKSFLVDVVQLKGRWEAFCRWGNELQREV